MKLSKLLLSLLFIAIACSFTACSEDDETTTSSTVAMEILGTWKVGTTTLSAQVLGITVPGTEYAVSESSGDLWEFTDAGEILVNSESAYAYAVEGNLVTINYGDGTSVSFTASIYNNALSLSSTVLNANTLSLIGISLDGSWLQSILSYSQLAMVYNFSRD